MTAYELADELEDRFAPFCDEAANMLRSQSELIASLQESNRQQADRIAELEKCLIVEQEHNMMLEELESELRVARVAIEIYEEKQSEPVAWLIQAKTWHEFTFNKPADDYNENESIEVEPLYTTPQTKSLSDEEIEEIAKQHLSAYAQFIGAGETWYEGEIEFARAIEAKVRGEK